MKSRALKIAIPALLGLLILVGVIASLSGTADEEAPNPSRPAVFTTTVTLTAPEDDATHAASQVPGSFSGLPGISKVEVDEETGVVTVRYDAALVEEWELVLALEATGFDPRNETTSTP